MFQQLHGAHVTRTVRFGARCVYAYCYDDGDGGGGDGGAGAAAAEEEEDGGEETATTAVRSTASLPWSSPSRSLSGVRLRQCVCVWAPKAVESGAAASQERTESK